MVEKLDKREDAISGMFNEIAPKYDFINHLLSFNIDVRWRKKVVGFLNSCKRENGEAGQFKVIDIACGTGDSSIALYKSGMAVTGADISQGMLEVAIQKNAGLSPSRVPLPEYLNASAESLPFGEGTFDAAAICFGIRNFNDRDSSLGEIYRVIKKGGHIAILEFAEPENRLFRLLYSLYLKHMLPGIGGFVSNRRSAYRYLAKSIEDFPKYEKFCNELSEAGFNEVKYESLTGGIALLYTGKKS